MKSIHSAGRTLHALSIGSSKAFLIAVTLAALALPSVCRADEEEGFKPIFNEKNLDGWDGNPEFWSFQDGTITGHSTADHQPKNNTFCVWRLGTVDDFALRLSYKITGGNSGIQYRSREFEKWGIGGYQADFEAGKTYSGILYEERMRGILAERGKKVVIAKDGTKEVTQIGNSDELQALIKPNDWNDYEVIAQGNHLIHKINGKVTSECIDNQEGEKKGASSGLLALQLHRLKDMGMTAQFKNIRLKRLPLSDGRKKIVLVAGRPSHGSGEHEFNAGTQVLKSCLDKLPNVVASIYLNPGGSKGACDATGWPKDPTAFDNADTIQLFMDGGGGHPLITDKAHLEQIGKLMQKGVGLCCAHYAVEIPKDNGGPQLTRWIGGYYERDYSINPHWDADFKELPKHPIASGVKPFKIRDEWYFNMRFPEAMSGVDPILIATPPDDVRRTPAAKEHPGRPEIVAWATQRPDGGRGFGFTGAHFHKNWGEENFRKVVLNALVWTAKGQVPANGIESSVTPEQLKENLDPKAPKSK